MANHWNKDFSAKVQVCSIDTLTARGNFWPEADLVVIDEAHMATSKGYHELSSRYPDAFFLPVTATPYTKEPLRHVADAIVHPVSVKELMDMAIDSNYTRGLIRPRYFAPSKPDLKGVKISGDDYAVNDLEKRMNTLTGDIILHWKKYAENRPTVLFACNISHSISIAQQFRASGITAEHIEGNNTFAERQAALSRLEKGETRIICNVGVLCTGVDIPFLGAIVMARPTKSYNLYIQQAGRGTRPCPDRAKQDFLILDHASNVLKHGFIDDEPDAWLDGKTKIEHDIVAQQCGACYAIFESKGNPICPECNAALRVNSEREMIPEQVDGVLAEMIALHGNEFDAFIHRIKRLATLRGYKKGWMWYQVKDRYGEETANTMFPRRKLPPWLAGGT
jgi:superfamily II DNA or RNA helicase